MPEPTDLVTNLPADFEVFGQAVATDLQYLLGGTTGQVLAKASGTDLDFDWVTDASGMTNPMTTTADVIYSSSGSTPARLGIGTANQVLAVNSGATAPEWQTISSGGMTLLSTTTLSGATTNITSIDQTYITLQMIIEGLTLSTSEDIFIKFNTSTTPELNGVASGSTFNKATGEIMPAANASTSIVNYTIINYASTSFRKPIFGSGTTSTTNALLFGGSIPTNTAISAINFSAGGAATYTGGTVRLYGVK
jgi:hypothetical protein